MRCFYYIISLFSNDCVYLYKGKRKINSEVIITFRGVIYVGTNGD
jgi:hypothetical protein